MPRKFTKALPTLAAALIVTTTYGLILPSPALAQPWQSCSNRVHDYCNANWQDFYASREDCLNAELANCRGTAAMGTPIRLVPSVTRESLHLRAR
jgi:hypothetical protein